MATITTIEGIGPAKATKLRAAGWVAQAKDLPPVVTH